jgi:hypothetical protein
MGVLRRLRRELARAADERRRCRQETDAGVPVIALDLDDGIVTLGDERTETPSASSGMRRAQPEPW